MSSEPTQLAAVRPNRLFLKHIVRKIFLEDWAIKLAALVITMALWLGVTGLSTPTTQRMTAVPLSLRFSNEIEVTNAPTQEVDIVISGDKRKIAQINKNDLVVSRDISDFPPGDRVIELEPETVVVSLPTGVKLDEVQPSRIAVRIEAVEEKEIPVQAETAGEVPEGYELYGSTVTPEKVRVRGPAGFIKTLNFVSTERIDLSTRTGDFTIKQVPVSVSNPRSTVLETVVDVTFRIGERRLERLYLVPVRDQPGKRATVVLYGGRSLFENVLPKDMQVEMVRSETGDEVPKLTLPPNLEDRVEVRRLKVN